MTLVAPDRVDGMMQSLVDTYRQGGWLPLWRNLGYTGQMIGGPAEVVLAEAHVKGFRGFDVEGAWEAVVKNATIPQKDDLKRRWPPLWENPPGAPETRGGLTRYMRNGYVSQDETDESVSRTLDYAFDDASVACFARSLGRTEEATRFFLRSKNYTNLWNVAARCFLPRSVDGSWLAATGAAYTETTPDAARWCVPHDVEGLVGLMGGREAFIRELDEFFEREFFRENAIGRSVHGNETVHHLAYMYNRVGAHDRTCQRVREIQNQCYSDERHGFDGNEDCGQMSAWYILSALG